jgi:LPXTG-motif cell wall-anchored protein
MKLHRVLATATVTAVIGSVALFASPAAFATGETPADTTPSASAAPTTAPAPSSTTASPAAGGADAGQPAGQAGVPAATGTADPAAPSASVKASSGASAAAEPSPTYTRPAVCSGIPDEERGKTSLRGLPSKIVAGSGWHDFAYRVTNVSTVKVMETDVSLNLGTADPKLDDISQLAVTVQWFNPATGAWKAIEGDGADVLGSNDFATVKTLAPGEYADARMRIEVGEKAEAGTGYFFTIGHSYGEDGTCGFDDISEFDFAVLAAGSEPGKVGDAQGKPGKPGAAEDVKGGQGGGNVPAPQGGLDEIPVTGSLAETGSSSTLPTTAALGGAALVLGAGAVFLVRRRKAGSAA